MNARLLIDKGFNLRGKTAGQIKTVCPECSDSRKNKRDLCLSIDIDKGVWNCHNCGYKGGVFDRPKKEFTKPFPRLEVLSKEAIAWFEGRGISNMTINRMKLSQAVEFMPQAGKDMSCICFNYYRKGELVNIKFRDGKKDFKMSAGSELIFYNLDALEGQRDAFIVEGEIDCLTLIEAGIYNVVSVPNGASKGSMKLEYLDNCWREFEGIERIYVLTDNDEPGIALREEIARRFGIERCFKFDYPEGCKDANEVLCKYGKEGVKELASNPLPFPIEGIIVMDDIFDEIVNYYENGYPHGIKTGISKDFDDHLQLMPGQFTMVTGIPGSGKSEFVDLIMTKTAMDHGWSWGVCSFENQPTSFHVTKLMEKVSGKAFSKFKDPSVRITPQEFEQSIYIIDQYFSFININQVDVTLDGILEKARELVLRKGLKGLLIDPWNYIEYKLPSGYTETQYISESLTKVKAFCLRHGVHIIIIAHPKKLDKDKGTGKYEVPTLYSISGSAHFFNKTDNGISVYRDFQTNQVDVYIQKVRYSWLGKIGMAHFTFDTDYRQYKPLTI